MCQHLPKPKIRAEYILQMWGLDCEFEAFAGNMFCAFESFVNGMLRAFFSSVFCDFVDSLICAFVYGMLCACEASFGSLLCALSFQHVWCLC